MFTVPGTKRKMKTGILVYDKADAEYNEWFINEIITKANGEDLKISLLLTETLDAVEDDSELLKNCDFAIMRNRNYKMSQYFESKGIKCFNSSPVCEIGNDKWEMYQQFCKAGIPVMYTQQKKLPFPFVMKPRDGHGGKNVFIIKNAQEYEAALNTICDDYAHMSDNSDKIKEFIAENYIYQFLASETGRDIRVYVLGDMILTAMERTASGDEFRANFSLGGSAKEHALTEEELRLAARVAKLIKPDFIGIDIIYNAGKPVVNEIEDAVGTRMLYKYTDIDPVKEYVSWIAKQLI